MLLLPAHSIFTQKMPFSLLHASKLPRRHLSGQAFYSKALVWSTLDTLKQFFLNHMVRGDIF